MKMCEKCNTYYNDDCQFCTSCGSELKELASRIKMKCRNCDGDMEVDYKHQILVCQYCGSSEQIVESDDVKKQRIISEAYKEAEIQKHTILKDVILNETELKQQQLKLDEKKADQEELQRFRKGYFSKGLLVYAILVALAAIGAMENSKYSNHATNIAFYIIGSIQALAFFTAWLIGSWCTNKKIRRLFIVFVALGVILIPIGCMLVPT